MSDQYPSTDEIRNAVLTPEREKEARRIRAKPHESELMICALVNALDETTKSFEIARKETESIDGHRAMLQDALRTDSSDLDVYQINALSTALFRDPANFIAVNRVGAMYCSLKLNGEAGEIAEAIGKSMRDDGGTITPARHEALKKELGDVLWYVAALASELGFKLSEIADANIAKLADRKTRGVLGGSGSDR